jgi:hypothetical protein
VLVLHFSQDVISFSDPKGEVELLHDAGEPPDIRCKTARVRALDWARAFGAIAELALIGDGVRFEVDPRGIARFTARTAQALFYVWLPLCTQNGNHLQEFFGPITFAPSFRASSGGEDRATGATPARNEGSSSGDPERTKPRTEANENGEGAQSGWATRKRRRSPRGSPGHGLGNRRQPRRSLGGRNRQFDVEPGQSSGVEDRGRDGEDRIKAFEAETEERAQARQAKAPSKGRRGRH